MPRELDETWQLLEDFADAARLLHAQDGRDVLPVLCELVVKVTGADHASISSIRDGRFTTEAATSDVPEQADAIQYETGEGPCLTAIEDGVTVWVDDLAEDPRWPRFGPAAARQVHMRSMLAHVLPQGPVRRAVNAYSTRPGAFRPEHGTLVAFFGTTAAATLQAAHATGKAENLERALHNSRRIGVALGILMGTRRISLDDAWSILSKASQDNNVKLSQIADHVLHTGAVDAPPGGWGVLRG